MPCFTLCALLRHGVHAGFVAVLVEEGTWAAIAEMVNGTGERGYLCAQSGARGEHSGGRGYRGGPASPPSRVTRTHGSHSGRWARLTLPS